MIERDLMIWAAGVMEGCGSLTVTREVGPTGREYHALTLLVPLDHAEQVRRLLIAAGNGVENKAPLGFELGGPAAIKGFLGSIRQWLTPEAKSRFNTELRRFKQLKQIAR
jgi:hypothetical protein